MVLRLLSSTFDSGGFARTACPTPDHLSILGKTRAGSPSSRRPRPNLFPSCAEAQRVADAAEAAYSACYLPHSQPTAYCAHATQPTVPSAKRSQSATGVGRRSARVGGSGAALWAAHPHTRLGRAGRARGVSRARRTCGSRRGSPQPGSRAAVPAGNNNKLVLILTRHTLARAGLANRPY